MKLYLLSFLLFSLFLISNPDNWKDVAITFMNDVYKLVMQYFIVFQDCFNRAFEGFLDVIESQSAQAQENLAGQSDMLGLSDEAFLSGTQNIARSESDRLRSLFDLGEQSKVRARQGYGNIIQNILGQQAQGFNTGLQQAQFGFGQGRGLQQQTGQMVQGILGSLTQGASSIVAAAGTG